MKRFLAVLVVLSLALAQGTLPKDARFDQPVVQTGAQVPLPVLLEAMAKAVGLSPVLRDIPNVTVNADFNQKPFRQVWDLLIKTYGDGKLDYVLLDNNVILVAAPDVVQRAKGQPETVQAPAEPTVRQFYQVRSADPAQLAAFVSGELPGVSVKQVPGQSTLIITGTAKQQADVAALLDRADPVKEVVQPPPPTPPAEPTVRQFYQVRSADPAQLAAFVSGELPGVSVKQVPGQSTLIITGTAKQQADVAALLDRADPVKEVVQQPPPPTPPSEPTTQAFYQVRSSDPAQLAAFISGEISGVTVKQVPGQGILIITGTAKQQAAVAALLDRIDPVKAATPTAAPLVQKSFSLSHAKAADLAKVISDALSATPPQDQPAQGQAATPAATPKATVSAEPRTNTLIVTGTADQIAQVERLIPQLDRPIQQVQLQIRVQSVNSEVFRNLGVKWETLSGGNLIASVLSSAGQGLNLIFDATRSLTSLNIKATLDALEGQSLSRRLSDANLLVLDNYGSDSGNIRDSGSKGAEVKVGGQLIIPITGPDGKATTREFDYGLTVRVRPQITADGNLVLEVYTTVGDDPAAGPTPSSIRIPQQSTLSSLRIRDGQTVVIGGLIQQTSSETINQVPILGSIPLIGELFKTRENSTKSDELIVIVTGNIVKDAATK